MCFVQTVALLVNILRRKWQTHKIMIHVFSYENMTNFVFAQKANIKQAKTNPSNRGQRIRGLGHTFSPGGITW